MSAEDQLIEAIVDVEETIQAFRLAANPDDSWRAGPHSPAVEGSYHGHPLWGIHFENDRPLRFGQTLIQSRTPGTFTARVYPYQDDGTVGEHVDQKTIDATGEPEQLVDLDLFVPPGEWLLTRPIPTTLAEARDRYGADVDNQTEAIVRDDDDEVDLMRSSEHDRYDVDSRAGVQFHGSLNPLFSSNDLWYYFYNLEVATIEE